MTGTAEHATTDAPAVRFHERDDGVKVAYALRAGGAPTVVFLPGYASHMDGTKALWLDAHCRTRGCACLRFDYQGHGRSSGRFEDGTIGAWSDDAVQLLRAVTTGPLLLVGSSMGAWMALIVARSLAPRVVGLACIAPAADFTEALMPARLGPELREVLARDGIVYPPSQYTDDPYPVTQRLIDSGAAHTVLNRPYRLTCPLRIVHGTDDADVPWQHGHRLFEHVDADDVRLTLIRHGDHRLSSPAQLELLGATVDELVSLARDDANSSRGMET